MHTYYFNTEDYKNLFTKLFDENELINYISWYRESFPEEAEISIKLNDRNSPCVLFPIFSENTVIKIPLHVITRKEIYDENDWNIYPTVQPPNSNQWTQWLVQTRAGNIFIAHHNRFDKNRAWYLEPIFSIGLNITDKVIAFRKLPEPYNAEETNS